MGDIMENLSFINVCRRIGLRLRPAKIKPVIKADPDDDKVLACAKAAKAEIITSGDNHLLDLKEFDGIRILTVNQLLEEVQQPN